MKKKLTLIIVAAVIAAALAMPALACTPPLNPPSSPHIEFNWTPSEEFEAGIKYGVDQYLKEHPLDLHEKETETEAETETVIETETETAESESEVVNPASNSFDWSKYIPKSLRDRWATYIRR